MNKLFRQIVKIFVFITIIIFNFNCEKGEKPDKTKIKNQKSAKTGSVTAYAKFDECECHKEAMEILDIVIEIRNTFESLNELKKNYESKKEVKSLAKNWQLLTEACFQKNFARMFEPSDCNDLKSLEKKKNQLIELGIQIDQGENIKL